MKALVTGGTGFIGSHLVEALYKKGIEVRCLVRKTSNLKWLKDLPVEWVEGDCTEVTTLRKAVKGVEQVFHLAGVTKAIREETYFKVNAEGTNNLVHACLEVNPDIKKFIYLSSQAASGPCANGREKREEDPCEPVSPYGRSKLKGEEYLLENSHQLPILILRPSVVYGPRDRDVYAFFKILSKKVNPIFSNTDQKISLCYVDDIIKALLLASESKNLHGETFFLSDGQTYQMNQIGTLFAEAMGIHTYRIRIPYGLIFGIASFSEILSKVSRRPPLINRGKFEEMVQKNWVCDITKAKTLLGYNPQIPLREGVRLTYEWYRKEHWL
ncbi:MAG: NAD-dependent epimerase/dehydratase family protein [Thermodesulfobacteriota bacterium]